MNYKILAVALTTTLSLTMLTAVADDKPDASKLPPPSTAKGVTYDKDIKPILEASCVKCHHGDKAKGRIHLDSLEGVLKGGKEGPILKAGKSAESQMVFSVAHVGDEDDFMPPPKAKSKLDPLTPEQVGLIRAWIDQGAK